MVASTVPDHNPLLPHILEILNRYQVALSEHQLIRELQQLGVLPVQLRSGEKSSSLALFQTHFLVMNALYQLQQQLQDDGMYLLISPLAIKLQANRQPLDRQLSADDVSFSLRDYYLDWGNFSSATEQDVDSLLNGFWQYCLGADRRHQAYSALELTPGAGWGQIQQRYRKLAAQLHPDRGGCAVRFMQIREAYELLRQVHQ